MNRPDAEALRIFLRLVRPQPLADPYPLYARLRDLAPFLPIRFPGVPTGYLVSTFASCSALLRDPAFGPPSQAQLDVLNPRWRDNAFTRCLYRSMVFRSGSSHREARQVAARHFAPRQMAGYADELGEIAGVLVDRLAGHGPGPVDLVEHLALPFAALSLGRLLAIPDDEAIRLGRLARRAGGVFEQFLTAEQHRLVARAGEELVGRLAAFVAGRRDPAVDHGALDHGALDHGALDHGAGDHGAGDHLLGRLAAGRAGGDEQEQLGAAVLLFGAGFDSPASMVGLGTRLLLEHPEQAALVAGQPDVASRAVAEILRYEPPVQLVARTALRTAELGGREVAAGSLVFGLIAAANRDPAQVKEPEAFDVTRDQVPALSFGAGPHYCLGAHLAGLQGEVLFPRLLRRFPGLALAGEPVYRSPGSTLRGLDHLPLALGS
jgi:cytochrome P450